MDHSGFKHCLQTARILKLWYYSTLCELYRCLHTRTNYFIIDTDAIYNVHLQIPLPIAVQTLVRDSLLSLLWMMLAALDQKLACFHALTPPVITVHILKMLVFSVYLVSSLLVFKSSSSFFSFFSTLFYSFSLLSLFFFLSFLFFFLSFLFFFLSYFLSLPPFCFPSFHLSFIFVYISLCRLHTRHCKT